MARHRQEHLGGRGPRSLWERAGARAGDGAGALFARLDAQDALEAQGASGAQSVQVSRPDPQGAQAAQPREAAAAALDRLAARIRAGAWSDEIAALATLAARLGE